MDFATDVNLTRWVLSTIILGGLLFVFSILLKRFAPIAKATVNNKEREIKLIETQLLDTKHKICRIACKNKEYLILFSPNGTTVIDKYSNEN